MQRGFALKVHDNDNVATIFANDILPGSVIEVRDKKGNSMEIIAQDNIPYGHKIALMSINKGLPVIKYGEELGHASQEINPGSHVHVHNLESMRGRGDL